MSHLVRLIAAWVFTTNVQKETILIDSSEVQWHLAVGTCICYTARLSQFHRCVTKEVQTNTNLEIKINRNDTGNPLTFQHENLYFTEDSHWMKHCICYSKMNVILKGCNYMIAKTSITIYSSDHNSISQQSSTIVSTNISTIWNMLNQTKLVD